MRVEHRNNAIDVYVTRDWAKSAAIALVCAALVLLIGGPRTAAAIFFAVALVTAPLSWYQYRSQRGPRPMDRG